MRTTGASLLPPEARPSAETWNGVLAFSPPRSQHWKGWV